MAWWGKLIGGTVGFMLGGPLGALLVGSIGHQFDARARNRGGSKFLPGNQERTRSSKACGAYKV